VARAGSSTGASAVKEPEPQAPELEIPRLSGAGVGAGSLNLAFELGTCPGCAHSKCTGAVFAVGLRELQRTAR
jgi:hypothetical protein